VYPWEDVAELIRSEIPPTPGLSVYASDVDLVALPAIVCRPGDPLVQLDTMGSQRFRWSIDVTIVVPRANPAAAERLIHDLVLDVFATLAGSTFWFAEAGAITDTTVNGIDALSSTIAVQRIMGNG
jgi:hypothetical protein